MQSRPIHRQGAGEWPPGVRGEWGRTGRAPPGAPLWGTEISGRRMWGWLHSLVSAPDSFSFTHCMGGLHGMKLKLSKHVC